MKKLQKCCICESNLQDAGYDPAGALWRDSEGNIVTFKFEADDRCCNSCYERYVLPGREYQLKHKGDLRK